VIIDVTMTIKEGDVFRLGSPPAHISTQRFYHEAEGQYETIMLSLPAHTATHVDLVYTDRRMEPERMIGPGKLIDASYLPGKSIQLVDVKDQVDIQPGDFVFFRTDWSRLLGSEEYYDHPELAPEVVDWLIAQSVNAVGIDALGLAQGRGHGEYDRLLAGHDIFVIENLTNLAAIPHSRFKTYCLPLRMSNTDAIPARVLVEIGD
jgi:kynurenine formamidase